MSEPMKEIPGRILRDYLYVDVDKVKSIAGQLDSGVPEESRLTKKDATRTTMGWRTFLSYSPESSEEGYVQRSMLDSLFPELEEILEQGWLRDISQEFAAGGSEAIEKLSSARPEGSIFRITADGYLFDVRQLASLFANFSITMNGFQEFEKEQLKLAESLVKQTGGATPKKAPPPKKQDPVPSVGEVTELERAIEDYAPQHGMSSGVLRGMIHTARGAFTPGLQLFMTSSAKDDNLTLTARLEETGRYLVADPQILAAHYGFKPQRWTLVGTVGHYSEPPEAAAEASAGTATENEESEDFQRSRFVRTIHNSVRDMANSGLIGLPQHPGMAAIPIAIYRTVIAESDPDDSPPQGTVELES